MLCKVIFTPCAVGEGDYNGWNIEPDNGRPLNVHELRITYNPRMREHYKALLAQARKDYLASMAEFWREYKASKQSLEYTQAMRAWQAERAKFIREGRELKHTSL